MSRYVDSWSISEMADEILKSLDSIEHLLSNFQADMDSNQYMRESLDYDYCDLRKSLDKMIEDAQDLASDAKQAAEDEEDGQE